MMQSDDFGSNPANSSLIIWQTRTGYGAAFFCPGHEFHRYARTLAPLKLWGARLASWWAGGCVGPPPSSPYTCPNQTPSPN